MIYAYWLITALVLINTLATLWSCLVRIMPARVYALCIIPALIGMALSITAIILAYKEHDVAIAFAVAALMMCLASSFNMFPAMEKYEAGHIPDHRD